MVSTVVLAQADLVASWVGAGSTFAAAVVALGLARGEHRRAAAERRDEEKAQARLVVSRLLPDAVDRVAVVNNSDGSVFDVDVAYSVDGRPDGLIGKLGSLTPLPIDVLLPHELKTLSVIYLSADRSALVASSDYFRGQRDEVTITFLDSRGHRWRRVNNSPPVTVRDPDTPDTQRAIRRTSQWWACAKAAKSVTR